MSARKKKLILIILAAVILLLYFIPHIGKDRKMTADPEALPAQAVSSEAEPSLQEDAAALPSEPEPYVSDIIISEIMPKNHGVLQDEKGHFSDYIELYNRSEQDVSLSGWRLSDGDFADGWSFRDTVIPSGEYLIVFADGQDIDRDMLHTDFSLSGKETLSLFTDDGTLADHLSCSGADDNLSVYRDENGAVQVSCYPTPGFENTHTGYVQWQNTIETPSLLSINEVMVYNPYINQYGPERFDWIELKNLSSSPVDLSDFRLSDDIDELTRYSLPSMTLLPGDITVVYCCGEDIPAYGDPRYLSLALNSENEQLYLSSAAGELIDVVSLRDIPLGCTYGRLEAENGFFYFDSPSFYSANKGGYRFIAEAPVCLTREGIYENTASLQVELSGKGDVYYTTDGSLPTEESSLYTSPIKIRETSVIRAISVVPGAMPSRAATFSFIMNEGHTMPVVSLTTDDLFAYSDICRSGIKGREFPGSLSLFDGESSFRMNCGFTLSGTASIALPKKSFTAHFRGAYGSSTLNYDLFGDGLEEYSAISLRRACIDTEPAVMRNELCQNLSLDFSDTLATQRSRYCILYINGEYWGIYAIKDKLNRQFFADREGVRKESIVKNEVPLLDDAPFYREVLSFCQTHDMSDPENYSYFCSILDVDSLIDWMVLQGYTGNWDITLRNVMFYRSDESGGKWKLVFYDLDHAFEEDYYSYRNIFDLSYSLNQMAPITNRLVKNEEFRDRFIRRFAEAIGGVLSNESVLAQIDILEKQLAPEVARDSERWERPLSEYEENLRTLKDFITGLDYDQYCIDAVCKILEITPEEWAGYTDGK